ncbi:unnamed protein product, partial [Didymodactylos carnosus]
MNGKQNVSHSSDRHVSLANIASAFITERKSSSRRQNSVRRKKRLTVKDRQQSNHIERCLESVTSSETAMPFRSTSPIICSTISNVHNTREHIALYAMSKQRQKPTIKSNLSFYSPHECVLNTSPTFDTNINRTIKSTQVSSSSSTTLSTTNINKESNLTTCNPPIILQPQTQISNFSFDQICPSSLSLQNKKDRSRVSGVPTSYAQFLKSRDIDKVKKILSQEDQRLLLSSEFFEDGKDSDPYVSVIARLGEAIQDSETLAEFVKKSFSIVTNT